MKLRRSSVVKLLKAEKQVPAQRYYLITPMVRAINRDVILIRTNEPSFDIKSSSLEPSISASSLMYVSNHQVVESKGLNSSKNARYYMKSSRRWEGFDYLKDAKQAMFPWMI